MLWRNSNFKADSIKYAEWMLIQTLQVCWILLFVLYFWNPSVEDNDRFSAEVCMFVTYSWLNASAINARKFNFSLSNI